MKKLILPLAVMFAAFCLFVSNAFAADVRISWQYTATTCADGSPLTNCPLTQFRVEKQNGTAWDALVSVEPTVFTYLHQNVPPGTHTYRVLAISQQAVSAPSNTASKTIPTVPPNPPVVTVAFNVSINGVVTRIDPMPVFTVNAANQRLSTVAGFIPSGVPVVSDPIFSYRGQTYCRVPPERVGFWRTSPTPNVAAPCA